jgi:dolichol kinase
VTAADLGALLVVSAVCAVVLAVGEIVRRLEVEAEWTRKLAHVLTGLVASTFAWVFESAWPVLAVCAAFAAVLGASSRAGWLPSIHRVRRRTAGAVWFPLGVASVFLAARGRADLYAGAVLVLALADPAAAIVGRTWGAHRLRAERDAKSVEGALAFLAVAAACLFVVLHAGGHFGLAASAGWALALGGVLAAVEALAPNGSDNFFVPVAALLLLRTVVPGA